MYSKPVISVIIPAYNEEKYIADCLRSIVSQRSSVGFEVIVVDNNSTDNTEKIARQFAVRVVRQLRQGRAFARQAGVSAAKGVLLVFTEADCQAPVDWVERIYQYAKHHSEIVGITGSYTMDDGALPYRYLTPIVIRLTSMLYRLFAGNHTFRGTNFMVRKDVFIKAGGFFHHSAPFDDVECGQRVGRFGPIHFFPHLTVVTSPRRVQGRLGKFLLEFFYSYTRVFLFHKHGHDDLYQQIR